MSDNEIYLLIKYIKSVLWRVAKYLSYIEEARCPKVKFIKVHLLVSELYMLLSLVAILYCLDRPNTYASYKFTEQRGCPNKLQKVLQYEDF